MGENGKKGSREIEEVRKRKKRKEEVRKRKKRKKKKKKKERMRVRELSYERALFKNQDWDEAQRAFH